MSKSNRYCRKIMRSDGLWNPDEDLPALQLKNWRQLFKSLGSEVLIIESEDDSKDAGFWIGSVCGIEKESIDFRDFDGCGKWLPATTIFLDHISQVQLRSRYAVSYARHLAPIPS